VDYLPPAVAAAAGTATPEAAASAASVVALHYDAAQRARNLGVGGVDDRIEKLRKLNNWVKEERPGRVPPARYHCLLKLVRAILVFSFAKLLLLLYLFTFFFVGSSLSSLSARGADQSGNGWALRSACTEAAPPSKRPGRQQERRGQRRQW
jgi:hypothetical protein